METNMINELKETSIIIEKVIKINDSDISKIIKMIKDKKIIFTGMGSSFFISEIGEYFLKNICLIDNIYSISADNLKNNFPFINNKYCIFTFSQSGNTKEVSEILKNFTSISKYCFTNNHLGNHLNFGHDNYIYDIGLEKSPVSTKYVIFSILFFYKISFTFIGKLNLDNLNKLKDFTNVFYIKYKKILEDLINIYKKGDHFIIIGDGLDNIVAKEISLKLRETLGITAIYDNIGQLNHGGINSINNNSICILLNGNNIDIISKIKNKGGKIITIGNLNISDISFDGIDEYLAPVIKIVLLDYFIHLLANKLNINTDIKIW